MHISSIPASSFIALLGSMVFPAVHSQEAPSIKLIKSSNCPAIPAISTILPRTTTATDCCSRQRTMGRWKSST